MVEVVQGFDRKQNCKVASLDLYHLVNGFGVMVKRVSPEEETMALWLRR
jgi:hypothetical protein